jgi:hypothetical protein
MNAHAPLQMVEWALICARIGPVFPCEVGGKRPLVKDHPNVATQDEKQIRKWWDQWPNANIGIACGDIVVIDFDTKKDESIRPQAEAWRLLWDAGSTATWSDGAHLFFKPPPGLIIGNGVGKIGPFIDHRGKGGYVLGPGSIVNGKQYKFNGSGPFTFDDLPQLPAELVKLIGKTRVRDPNMPKQCVPELDRPEYIARAAHYLKNDAPEAQMGAAGDPTTIVVINRVGDEGLSEQECQNQMLENWNFTKAHPPWEPEHLAEKIASAYKSRTSPLGCRVPSEFTKVELDEPEKPKRKLREITVAEAVKDALAKDAAVLVRDLLY